MPICSHQLPVGTEHSPLPPPTPQAEEESLPFSTWNTAFPGWRQKERAKYSRQLPVSPKLNSTSGKYTKAFPWRNIRSASPLFMAYLILLCPPLSLNVMLKNLLSQWKACKSNAITITLCFPAEGMEDTLAYKKLICS